ncbi:MAG: hypothetical protein M3010_12390, partial [Candidatus Dormibacteraeota bacterium]|nr:hypothetical protein [Candidatus Dormibacteraeota bacterium]
MAVVAATAALLAAASTLLGATATGHADDRANPQPAASPCPHGRLCSTPSPTDTPSPSSSPTPSDCTIFPEFCPSPSPSAVVVSPVAPDPTQTPTTPSYLQGVGPSPTQSADGSTVVSSPVPLGGGFVDQLPTPSQQASTGPTGDLAPHQSGLPLPLIAVGVLLILGAVGSLIYAIAPREKPVFTRGGPGEGGT